MPLPLAGLVLATSAISLTLAKSDMMQAWRDWMRSHGTWLGDLADCHYCISHWVALLLVGLYRPQIVVGIWGVDFIVSWFAIVGASAVVSALIIFLMRGRADH